MIAKRGSFDYRGRGVGRWTVGVGVLVVGVVVAGASVGSVYAQCGSSCAMPDSAGTDPCDVITPCTGFDAVDDTACWQATLCAAEKRPYPYFGKIEAHSNARYRISCPLVVRRSFGGVIEGNGAVLEWLGPHDDSATAYESNAEIPLFLLEDTVQLEIRDLSVEAVSCRLDTAFEFTNGPDPAPPFIDNVTPSLNILNHVYVGLNSTANGIDFGVRFTKRYGIDGNNDQATIKDSAFSEIRRAAVSIEHTQSHQHRFYNFNASAADGNQNLCLSDGANTPCGASFVRLNGGGFTSIGGFRANFRNAEYYLKSIYTPVTIVDSNSEECARFIDGYYGAGQYPAPVQVLGARYAPGKLDSDGRVVSWFRHGPINITGLSVGDGLPGQVFPVSPHLYFEPSPVAPTTNQGHVEVHDTYWEYPIPNATWDPIVLGPTAYVRLTASGNMCKDDTGVVPCPGLAGGITNSSITYTRLSALPALPNGHVLFCTDCTRNTSPCSGGGSGALAKRVNGTWDCDGGVVLASDTSVTRDSEWDTTVEINAATTDDDFVVQNAAQPLKNKDLTDTTNTFPVTGIVGFSSGTTAISATRYLGPNTARNGTTDTSVAAPVPGIRAKTLHCRASAAPTGSNKWSLRVPGSASGSGCTGAGICCEIIGSATTCATTANYAIAAGTQVSLQAQRGGSATAAIVECSLGIAP
jgi:hypothetical protein